MDIIYRAFDGTEFDNENICCDYERERQRATLNDSIIGMTAKGNIVKYADYDFFDKIRYIYIKDEKGIEAAQDRCYYEGITSDDLKGPGLYFWNDLDAPNLDGGDAWQSADTIIAMLNNIINEMINAENALINQLG